MFSLDKWLARFRGAAAAPSSVIGPDMVVTGDVVSSGRVHVEGEVKGDVRCAFLSQSESGKVFGNIAAGEARLGGLVDGVVEAEAVSLQASARVTGDVSYLTLAIESGALVEGRLKPRRSGEELSLTAETPAQEEEPAAEPVIRAELKSAPARKRGAAPRAPELFAPQPEAEAAE